ncbi:MAG: Crp/Fnr family transcriptional regulator [Chloroflexota bacterium]
MIRDAYRGTGKTFIVLAGRVNLFVIGKDSGRRFVGWSAEPGDVFGSVPMVSSQHNTSFDYIAESSECSVVREINTQRLTLGLAQFPEILSAFTVVYAKMVAQLQDKLAETVLMTPEQRLTSELVRISVRRGDFTPQFFQAGIDITHQELADLVGLARPTVTKALANLRRRGLLSVSDDGHYVISRRLLMDYLGLA